MNTARQKWIQMHGLSIAIFVFCVISVAIVGGTADKSSTSFNEKMGFTGHGATDEENTEDSPPRTKVIKTKYGEVQGRIFHLMKRKKGAKEGSKNSQEFNTNDKRNKFKQDRSFQMFDNGDQLTNLPPVAIYYGIPYATPPVGTNRWQPTRAPNPWEGILQATSHGPVCPQRFPVDMRSEKGLADAVNRMPKQRLRQLQLLRSQLLRQSEDCLYLNIFVPLRGEKPINSRKRGMTQFKDAKGRIRGIVLKPVMVYVHGESFQWGSGNLWDGRVLASYGDVLVVTFNYRLGILGFLNTNGSPSKRAQVANYGLMDQMAALQWIKENIQQFGGDPNRVTLFGHGTGAACIEYLVHSPTTVPGLFHRVILMSGSVFAPWASVREPLKYAVQLGRYFNCSIPEDLNQNHEKITECLRKIPADNLLTAKITVPSFHLDFGPSYDGVTIREHFSYSSFNGGSDVIKNKRSFGNKNYAAMIGIVSHDFFSELSNREIEEGIAGEQRDHMLQTYVRNNYNAHLQEILLTLQNEYTDWEDSVQHPTSVRNQVIQAFSDGLYASPAVFSARNFFRRSSKQKTTFFYHFSHHTKMGPYNQLHIGSVHGSELEYVFGIPIANVWPRRIMHTYTKSEIMLSKVVMTYWSNFAKSGSPNKPEHVDDSRNRYRTIDWEAYDQNQRYLEIGSRPRLHHHYRGRRLSLWLNLLPQLQKTGQNTIYPSHNSLILNQSDPFSSWGIIQNSSISSASNILDSRSIGAAATACSTSGIKARSKEIDKKQNIQNETLVKWEDASKEAYSYALAVAVGMGGVLCIVNGMLLLCICQRSGRRNCSKNNNNYDTGTARDSTIHSTNNSHAGSTIEFLNVVGDKNETPIHHSNLFPTNNRNVMVPSESRHNSENFGHFQMGHHTMTLPGRGGSMMNVSRGGQRTILLQHPHRGSDRIESDNSDSEGIHRNVQKQKPRMDSSFRDTYHPSLDGSHPLSNHPSGELILNNERPQSIHADSIMHSSTIHPPNVDRPSHSPTSFSLTTANIEFSDTQHKKSESQLKDHDNKLKHRYGCVNSGNPGGSPTTATIRSRAPPSIISSSSSASSNAHSAKMITQTDKQKSLNMTAMESHRWKDNHCVSFPLQEMRKDHSNNTDDRNEPSYAHINKSGHVTVDSFNESMPDPPEEFINLSTTGYGSQPNAVQNDSINLAGNKRNDCNATPIPTERKLIPILKTPPTLQRSSYNTETKGIKK